MDVAIAVVNGNKSYVFLFDYGTRTWKRLFRDDAYCQIKVLQRGRDQFIIEIAEEGNLNNNKQYSLKQSCEVTKVQGILQIPAGDPNACMLGIKFRDENAETQFLMRVGAKLDGFNKPLQNQYVTEPSPSVPSRPPPASIYNPPTLAPKIPFHNPSAELHNNLPAAVTKLPQMGGGNFEKIQEPVMNYDARSRSRTAMIGVTDYGGQGRGGGIDNIGYSPPVDPYRLRDQKYNQFGGNSGNYGNNNDFRNVDPHYNTGQQGNNYFDQGPLGRTVQEEPPYGRRGERQPQPPYHGGGYAEMGGRGEPPQQQDPYPRHINQQRTPPNARKPFNQPPPVDHTSSTMKSKMSDADFQSDVNHYAQQLASTLSSCNKEQAVKLVGLLTSMITDQREGCSASLGVFSMNYEPEKEVNENDNKTFSLSLQIEVFEKDSFPFYLTVSPSHTIEHLKIELQKTIKVPKECQTWIYGTQLIEDKQSLKDLEISDESDLVFVYVQHPKKVKGMAAKTLDQLKEVGGTRALPVNQAVPMIPIQRCKDAPNKRDYPLEPMEAPPMRNQNLPPLPSDTMQPPLQFLPQEIPSLPRPTNPRNDLDQAVFRGDSDCAPVQGMLPQRSVSGGVRVMPAEIPRGPQHDIPIEQFSPQNSLPLLPVIEPLPPPVTDLPPPTLVNRWECPSCTYRNLPYRPGCEMCDNNRPEDYVPPPNYQLTEEEMKWADQNKQQDMMLQKMFQNEQERKRKDAELNYNKLIETDDQALVTNTEPFDCPVCFCDINPGEGIILRSCLHQICKLCLHESVTKSEHVQVQCPFTDGTYGCNENISDREIRAVLSDDELEALYNRGLRQAEAAARDSFHCQTMDCPGFCFFEDEVNQFNCVVCKKLNCILCKAQHEGMNCQEYQDDLKRKATNDDAARQTQEMLEKMVTDGEAMHCPQCRVIVTKKIGCDWIKCTVCKTEMCWATKGPRWGPGGHGDTSGGCRCGLNRKRCHPNCRNCH